MLSTYGPYIHSGNPPLPEPDGDEPVIQGVGNITINVFSHFDPLAGVTAQDKQDGDLTGSIHVSGQVDVSTPGTYNLTYTVTDSDRNKTTVQRVVTVYNHPPEILGVANVTLNVGDHFDPKANVTAYDKEDGDLTRKIEWPAAIDTATAGVYQLTYSVVDRFNEKTSVTRTVIVNEAGKYSDYQPGSSYKQGDLVINSADASQGNCRLVLQ